jgi:hypothetical protein
LLCVHLESGDLMSDNPTSAPRKQYEKPAVIQTEVMNARAVSCAGGDTTSPGCEYGPITS